MLYDKHEYKLVDKSKKTLDILKKCGYWFERGYSSSSSKPDYVYAVKAHAPRPNQKEVYINLRIGAHLGEPNYFINWNFRREKDDIYPYIKELIKHNIVLRNGKPISLYSEISDVKL